MKSRDGWEEAEKKVRGEHPRREEERREEKRREEAKINEEK